MTTEFEKFFFCLLAICIYYWITYSSPFVHLQTTGLFLCVILVRGLCILQLLTRCLLSTLQIHAVPGLQWFDLQFFNFTTAWKWYAFSRSLTLNFELWSFPQAIGRLCRPSWAVARCCSLSPGQSWGSADTLTTDLYQPAHPASQFQSSVQ